MVAIPPDPNVDTINLGPVKKPFKGSVERWRTQVRYELDRQKVPLPEDLILSLISIESSGIPGLVNPRSNASGLGQIMPIALRQYNQYNPPIDWQTMRQKTSEASNAQIRVLVWTLAQYWVIMAKSKAILGTVGDLARYADCAYTAGQKPVFARIEKLPVPTWKNFFEKHFDWAPVKNHTIKVFKLFDDSQLDEKSIISWLKTRSKTLLVKASIFSPGLIALFFLVFVSKF